MKHPKWFLKLAAVASSLLLMAGFVCYRAGAFDWLRGTSSPPPDVGSNPTLEQAPVDPAPVGGTAANGQGGGQVPDPTLFYSSKSGAIIPPPATAPQPPSSTAQPAPALISGSKSIIFVVPPTTKPAAAPPPAIINGTKSGPSSRPE